MLLLLLLPCFVTGAKFYRPLSTLVPAIASGMSYSPVTKADLAKGYPGPGWNEAPSSAATAAAAAQAAGGAGAASLPSANPRQPASSLSGSAVTRASAPSKPSGSAAGATAAAGSRGSSAGLQQLLGGGDVKWRAVMPSGDRLGPYTGKELLSWLAGGGSAPKGVSREDAREVAANPGSLKLCGIDGKSYNQQKLPGKCHLIVCCALWHETRCPTLSLVMPPPFQGP